MKLTVIAIATAVVWAAAAGAASANSISFSGTLTNSDPTYVNDGAYNIGCGAATHQPGGTVRYDAFALRSSPAGDTDCLTVKITLPTCANGAVGFQLYAGSFDPSAPASGAFGGAGPAFFCGQTATLNGVGAPAGQTFLPLITSGAIADPGIPYTITFSGTNVVAAQEVQAGGVMPRGNVLSLHASSLPDGSAVEGAVAVNDGSGHSYAGPVRCLRIDGQSAALVMTFDGSQTGVPAFEKGAVFWLHENADGSGGQRNSLLSQRQLARRFATCPDPLAPPTGTWNPLGGTGGHVSVVTDPPPAT